MEIDGPQVVSEALTEAKAILDKDNSLVGVDLAMNAIKGRFREGKLSPQKILELVESIPETRQRLETIKTLGDHVREIWDRDLSVRGTELVVRILSQEVAAGRISNQIDSLIVSLLPDWSVRTQMMLEVARNNQLASINFRPDMSGYYHSQSEAAADQRQRQDQLMSRNKF